MEDPNYRPLIVASKRRAIFALCFAVFCAAVEFWDLFAAHPQGKPNWFIPYNSAFPDWAGEVLNLVIAVVLIWALAAVCRYCKRGERVFFALCFAEVLLIPVKTLVPMPMIGVIVWVQALGTLGMIAAAVFVYRGLPAPRRVKATPNPSETRP